MRRTIDIDSAEFADLMLRAEYWEPSREFIEALLRLIAANLLHLEYPEASSVGAIWDDLESKLDGTPAWSTSITTTGTLYSMIDAMVLARG